MGDRNRSTSLVLLSGGLGQFGRGNRAARVGVAPLAPDAAAPRERPRSGDQTSDPELIRAPSGDGLMGDPRRWWVVFVILVAAVFFSLGPDVVGNSTVLDRL